MRHTYLFTVIVGLVCRPPAPLGNIGVQEPVELPTKAYMPLELVLREARLVQ